MMSVIGGVLNDARMHRGWLGALLLQGVLVLAGAWPVPALAVTPEQKSATAAAPARPVVRNRRGGAGIDAQVKSLAKALGLDANQQAELKTVLQAQFEDLVKASADTAAPQADRLNAVETANAQLVDRIRSLLNDEQKKKFNATRPESDVASAADPTSAERSMNPVGPK
jgi:hypothetical protein